MLRASSEFRQSILREQESRAPGAQRREPRRKGGKGCANHFAPPCACKRAKKGEGANSSRKKRGGVTGARCLRVVLLYFTENCVFTLSIQDHRSSSEFKIRVVYRRVLTCLVQYFDRMFSHAKFLGSTTMMRPYTTPRQMGQSLHTPTVRKKLVMIIISTDDRLCASSPWAGRVP